MHLVSMFIPRSYTVGQVNFILYLRTGVWSCTKVCLTAIDAKNLINLNYDENDTKV